MLLYSTILVEPECVAVITKHGDVKVEVGVYHRKNKLYSICILCTKLFGMSHAFKYVGVYFTVGRPM